MSDTKKDLTRIEDLGELLHNADDDAGLDTFGKENTALEELPDLPPEEETPPDFNFPSEETNNLNSEEQQPFETETSDEHDSFAESTSTEEFTLSEEEPSQEFSVSTEETEQQLGEETTFESEETFSDTPHFEESENLETSDEPFQETNNFSDESLNTETADTFEEELPVTETDDSPTFENNDAEEIVSEKETELIAEVSTPATESFAEVKNFAQNISYGDVSFPGNPPFTLLVAGENLEEYKSEIIEILTTYQVIKPGQEQEYSDRIERGSILIPRISEYAGIFLANALKHYASDISLGPSDHIRESRSYPPHEEIGVVSKKQLFQNKNEQLHWNHSAPDKRLEQMPTTTLSTLPGHVIEKWLGVLQHHVSLEFLTEEELKESANSMAQFEQYQTLLNLIKNEADKLGANALVAIQSQLIRHPQEEKKYQLLVTANAVKVKKEMPWEQPPSKNTTLA